MIKFGLFLLSVFLSTILVTFVQAHIAFTNHIQPHDNADDINQRYADSISELASPDVPLVVIIPLNGFPDDSNHPSYKNARAALEILDKTKHSRKYLMLSEGYTGDACYSGAAAAEYLLQIGDGFIKREGVELILENDARTTYENIKNSKKILEQKFPNQKVEVIIAGMTDVVWERDLDIGHGSRAYTLAKEMLTKRGDIEVIGFLPTNLIDTSIGTYPRKYNLLTYYLGSNMVLHLPYFDKSNPSNIIQDCPDL